MAVRNWCFTINNYSEKKLEECKAWECKRIVVGEEVGEEGTPHIQGAITFNKPTRLAGCKKLNGRAHWEEARQPDAAFKYCKKDGKFWEKDDRKPGARTDIAEAVAMHLEGKSVYEIAIKTESYQAARMAELLTRHAPFKSVAMQRDIIWFWGPTGTGKSLTARTEWPDLYLKTTYKWWDGYNNEETILIDDFRPTFCSFDNFLTMTDIYAYRAEYKTSSMGIPWKRFVITCPYPPEVAYRGITTEDEEQLLRRITEIRHFPDRLIPIQRSGVILGPTPVANFTITKSPLSGALGEQH